MGVKFMVVDGRTIINPQGIRFVEKIDEQPYASGGIVKYRLRVTYKGDVLNYQYEGWSERDAQFQRLRETLGPPPTDPPVDPTDRQERQS